MTKYEAIIVDIDGTLANCEHRRHFIDKSEGKQDWKSFYMSMRTDTVNEWCRKIMDRYLYAPEHDYFSANDTLILVSGRPEEYRPHTIGWLNDNDIHFSKLLMRQTGDYRCDTIIKQEIYEEHIKPHYDVLFVLDDRPKVCRMWRSLGLVCLQVDDKEF